MKHPSLDLHRAIFEEPLDTLSDGEHHFGHLIAAMSGMEGIEMARAIAVAGHRLLADAGEAGETWHAAHPTPFHLS